MLSHSLVSDTEVLGILHMGVIPATGITTTQTALTLGQNSPFGHYESPVCEGC